MSRNATLLGLCVLVLGLSATPVLAQSRTVTGQVVDAGTGDPLPFVNVVIQGTTRGAATDIDGNYSIEVDGPDAVLVYRFLGYITQEEIVGARDVINVELEEDSNLLDDVVVVGYGTQRRGDVTSSVSTVDIDEADVGLVTSPTDYIEGRVAGVQLIPSGGEPGAGINVRIRGGTSISASNEPLYVIDGVPVDGREVTPAGSGQVSNGPARNPLSLINPNDIESITVLKDASATAIYGSRGANGVVLVTTKNGAEGRTTVEYEGQTAVSTPRTFDILTADEYRAFVRDNLGADVLASQEFAGGNVSSDFQDELFRDAISQSHNLSFSNGTSSSQYRASISYLNNEGTVISSGQERVTARLNANNQFFDGRLRLGLNLTSALTEDDFAPINATGGFEGGALQNVIDFRPILPIFDDTEADGFYEITGQRSVRNPVALVEQLDESARTTRTLGNLSAEFDLVEGLTAQFNVGGDRSIGRRRSFLPNANPFGAELGGSAYQRELERTSVTLQSYLTYAPEISEDHNLDLLGGYEFNEFDTRDFSLQGQGYVTDVTGADDIAAAENLIPGGCGPNDGNTGGPGSFSCRFLNRLISYFGRANYNFSERYYLTASLRYDGSSRFSPDNRYALFPAVSVAWRLSEEPFLANNALFNDLRLRAGFGIVGNQDIPDYLYLSLLQASPDATAILGGQPVTGYAPNQLSNPDLKWEEKQEFTVGLDYGVLSGRIFGALEFYQNTTDDLLLEVPLAQPAPVSSQFQNVGSVRNTGVDFSVEGYIIDRPGLSLRLNGVFNTNRNEIRDLGGREQIFTGTVSGRGQSGTNSLLLTPGQPFPVFFGPVFDGFDGDGNPTFVDLDGDGTVEINGDDREILGNPLPDFTYGIGFNLQAGRVGLKTFFRGEQGREVFNNGRLVYGTRSVAAQGRNFLDLDYDPAEAVDAAPVYSSLYIEDGSFFRLDNVTVEYDVPLQSVAAAVQSARVYLSADNLFVLSPYSGIDPEVNTNAQVGAIPSRGIDYLNYPRPRTISVGVLLGF